MTKARKTTQSAKHVGTITLPHEAAISRFREVLIRFEGIPVDANVIPPFLSGTPDPKIQEIWIFGLEIESDGQNHTVKSFSLYADTLMKSIMSVVKPEDCEEPDIQDIREGLFAIFTLGMGQPEQLRICGPLTEKAFQTLSHDRVLREFANLLSPITHLPPNPELKPRLIGTVEDMDLITTFAMPKTFSGHLADYTSGLMIKLGETVLAQLPSKSSSAEYERANARLALARARTSVAQGLAGLKL